MEMEIGGGEAVSLSSEQSQHVRTLLQALCLVSRDLPLPPPLLHRLNAISLHSEIQNGDSTQRLESDESGEQMQGDSQDSHLNAHPLNHHADDVVTLLEEKMEDISSGESDKNDERRQEKVDLIENFQDALVKQRPILCSSSNLRSEFEQRIGNKLTSRLLDLEVSRLNLGESLQRKALMELRCLKLTALQKKIRSEVRAELYLQQHCTRPDKMLFDWGLMRLARAPSGFFGGLQGYGVNSGMSPTEADERLRRKREAERQRRLEEEEQTRITLRKRKFFNELLNFVREIQLQGQAIIKRRKQRNDAIQAWHAKQRQRATRAERLRYQALKADDQEAYMRMVEESKNERLTTLLEKTDELLHRLGAMVQMQKDADRGDGQKKEKPKEKGKDATKDVSELPSPRKKKQDLQREVLEASDPMSNSFKATTEPVAIEELQDRHDESDGEGTSKKRNFLEGQRQYNSLVHSIKEKVTRQPAMLKGGELRSYQLEGLQWMLSLYNNNLNGILADEMGLGKTIQTIALLAYLLEKKGLTGPHLIIAPKAVLPNWAHEFATWAPSMVSVLYDGRLDDRKFLREQYREGKFNVLLTHYDLIMRDKAFLRKIQWDYMIVDEGHRLKNHDCILSRTLVTGYNIRRRLLLTGTPIQNSLQELWSLLNFLLPAIFNSGQNFEEWFNAPFADPSEVSLTEEEQLLIIRRLHQVIRPFLLRRKKSEVESFLPSKIQVILKCDLSAWQRVYYQQITDSGRVGLSSKMGKSKGLLNTAMQLRKCCNHPYLFLHGLEHDLWRKDEIIRASGKFELLDRLLPKLQRTGHRVLLFSQMTRLMDILEIYLNLQGFKYLRLDGGTKTEDRGRLLALFNQADSPYFMFLLSTRAGGLGLNLQTADTVILFDSDWNPQMDQQAEDRAHRIGQKKEVRVFVLVSVGSIEEEILERAKSKMGIDAKVIQAGLFNTTSTAQERRAMLEEIMRRGADSLGTDVPSEREINRLAARTDEEFRLFEKMDEERRKKEGYRSRLMEEHEIPEWVFLLPDNAKKVTEDVPISGKRQRKEILYTDVLNDSQWLKAVEEGEDMAEAVKMHLSKRTKRIEQPSFVLDEGSEPFEDAMYTESGSLLEDVKKQAEHGIRKRKINFHASTESFEDPSDYVPTEARSSKKLQIMKLKHSKEPAIVHDDILSTHSKDDVSNLEEEQPFSWKALRRKRTSHSHFTSDDGGSAAGTNEFSENYDFDTI